ncbi:helix-turn-helix domain-containing protein [Crateriforma conspicua]|uniref:helix-turn-helix domain-containing protein n=1 Tax=Crateriforma conspicua TaxID=2527996 RepID=UPI001188F8AA|nr:helix-turn-helix domain-containing protein [Crateriforma conspicua]QDV66158.1 hypothetical protein Mal65_53330 [Crateriforma conspicua]
MPKTTAPAGPATLAPFAVDRKEAARLICVSVRMLQELTHPNGPIRSKRVGAKHVYPIAELQRFLDVSTETAGE